MARLFYIHWHKDECLAEVDALREVGHVVRYHYDTGEEAWKLLKQAPPEILVVSLERLPSHGRRVAAVTKETKKLRDLPVVFVGGAPAKVEVAKKEFPNATFCSFEELTKTVAAVGHAAPTEITPENRQAFTDMR